MSQRIFQPPGKIITFYSYKGGTGRSMALANVAWILATNGKKVLVVDWDLEAPGLHHYFRPFLVDKALKSTPGIFDLVFNYTVAALTPGNEETGLDWYKPYADIFRYAVSLEWDFPSGGGIDFVPAGQQDSAYASKLGSFNWKSFYEVMGAGRLLEEVKQRMRSEYHYILIDSRTGVGDTSGICTIEMPDTLVLCFTLNRQNFDGTELVAKAVEAQRQYQGTYIRVVPVPMRIELAERELLQRGLRTAAERFNPFLDWLPTQQQTEYWQKVQFAYEPFYAYNELIAALVERSGGANSLLRSAEYLTAYLSDGEVSSVVPIPEADRHRVLNEYMRE